jgi:hypothetical protein
VARRRRGALARVAAAGRVASRVVTFGAPSVRPPASAAAIPGPGRAPGRLRVAGGGSSTPRSRSAQHATRNTQHATAPTPSPPCSRHRPSPSRSPTR